MQWTDSIATNKSFVLEWGEGVKMQVLFSVVLSVSLTGIFLEWTFYRAVASGTFLPQRRDI